MKKKFKDFLLRNKNKNFFIISGLNSYLKSNFKKIFQKELAQINNEIYLKKKYLPEIDELKDIIQCVKKFNPDLIIAVGGGCALDYAKIVSVSTFLGNFSIKNFNNIKINEKIPLIAIPTTAGSGSEVTEGAVIYENKIKYSLENKLIVPDKYFLIPELVLNNTQKIKANSGFDALSQSIESILSKKSNSKSIKHASKALKLIKDNFLQFYSKPSKINSFKMQQAANFAGRAICISKTTAPHAVSYPFSIYYNVSHGHAVSLTLNEFLKFNYQNINKAENPKKLHNKFNIIFKLTSTKNIFELVNFISEIKKRIKFKDKLKNFSINLNKALPKILNGINIKRLKNNPVELKMSDIKKIINQIK